MGTRHIYPTLLTRRLPEWASNTSIPSWKTTVVMTGGGEVLANVPEMCTRHNSVLSGTPVFSPCSRTLTSALVRNSTLTTVVTLPAAASPAG